MHLLPGTPLHLWSRKNLERVQRNILPYALVGILWAFAAVTMKVCQLDFIFQLFIPGGDILMPSSLLTYLKVKLVVLPHLILSVY
jgi:hypothetical protein